MFQEKNIDDNTIIKKRNTNPLHWDNNHWKSFSFLKFRNPKIYDRTRTQGNEKELPETNSFETLCIREFSFYY